MASWRVGEIKERERVCFLLLTAISPTRQFNLVQGLLGEMKAPTAMLACQDHEIESDAVTFLVTKMAEIAASD
jgi:hypothetical protein